MRIATVKETAEYLRIGLSTFYKKIATDPTLPHSFKIGGRPLFNLDAIDEWILEQEKNTNTQGGKKHVK